MAMTHPETVSASKSDATEPNRILHAIAWRWHFYAGLYVIPFLVMLASTGMIMLWVSAVTELKGERSYVPVTGPALQVSALQAAALAAVPGGTLAQYVEPMGEGRVALMRVNVADEATGVLLNPYTGEVVQTFVWGDGWYDLANKIHGTLLIGDLGDRLIEITASLGILMVVSGVYLHWPRNAERRMLPRLAAKGRGFWVSLHGVVGLWASGLMLVFLISGLSWAGVWGGKLVQAWNTFPAEKFDAPLSDKTHAEMGHATANDTPWTLEQTPVPASGSLKGMAAIAGPVTLDSAVAFARGLGFQGRFQLSLPGAADGVWTISHDSMSNDGPRPWQDRTLHIDQYTGNVLADVQFADYSPYAKAMAVGVAFHEGDLGAWNMALNTVFCLTMIFLSVSGVVMWWKRRPAKAGRLVAPPKPEDAPLQKGAALLVVVVGLAFPMAGAAIVAILAFDWLVIRRLPALNRALS